LPSIYEELFKLLQGFSPLFFVVVSPAADFALAAVAAEVGPGFAASVPVPPGAAGWPAGLEGSFCF
jgi:hypothetical protein